MDPPDMSFVRGRELLDPSPDPPIRLQMPSGLSRDPITDKNSIAHFYVDSASTVAEPPTSLGIHPQGLTTARPGFSHNGAQRGAFNVSC